MYVDYDEDLTATNTNVYGVVSAQTRTARTGDVVSNYVLRNAEGYINAVQFNNEPLKEGNIYKITGVFGYYNGAPQINIFGAEEVEPTRENIAKVLPTSKYATEDVKS